MPVTEREIFMQALLARKVCSEAEAIDLYAKARQNLGKAEAAFEDFLENLNGRLFPLSMKLAKYHCPKTGKVDYALINMISDKASQFASQASQLELDFFKFILESIFHCTGFLATKQELLSFNLSKGFLKRDAEAYIEKCIDLKWLQEVSQKITYGTRTLLELGSGYIKDEFGELPECTLCSEIATIHVEYCSQCQSILHINCRERLFQKTALTGKCPTCKEVWKIGRDNKVKKRSRPAAAAIDDEGEDVGLKQDDDVDMEITQEEGIQMQKSDVEDEEGCEASSSKRLRNKK